MGSMSIIVSPTDRVTALWLVQESYMMMKLSAHSQVVDHLFELMHSRPLSWAANKRSGAVDDKTCVEHVPSGGGE